MCYYYTSLYSTNHSCFSYINQSHFIFVGAIHESPVWILWIFAGHSRMTPRYIFKLCCWYLCFEGIYTCLLNIQITKTLRLLYGTRFSNYFHLSGILYLCLIPSLFTQYLNFSISSHFGVLDLCALSAQVPSRKCHHPISLK